MNFLDGSLYRDNASRAQVAGAGALPYHCATPATQPNATDACCGAGNAVPGTDPGDRGCGTGDAIPGTDPSGKGCCSEDAIRGTDPGDRGCGTGDACGEDAIRGTNPGDRGCETSDGCAEGTDKDGCGSGYCKQAMPALWRVPAWQTPPPLQ